ncbi:hypothetical protein C427_0330 [Paraglaciecola psychrophila 170]|uniref:Uncharacterized protein n=1 Tax=Paraglaciecola psychrophila 170 TaxID=1129794 RepID=K6YY19_9ALTE|nr:hypothetical protein C427_0330 [Paraglaciecola psychrophila 170]GAC37629.1 hypothetical protein GPSY_2007 [Paraglaciecola psychrophila 170]
MPWLRPRILMLVNSMRVAKPEEAALLSELALRSKVIRVIEPDF